MKKSFQTQLLLVLALTFLNLVLLLVNIGAISIPGKGQTTAGPERPLARKEISVYKVGKEIEIAGYKIKFENPRYEFDEEALMDTFKLDARLENISFEPEVQLIANCDLTDSGEIVKEGVGIIIRTKGDHLRPGESTNFTIVTLLEIDYDKESQTFEDDRDQPGGHVSLFPNRKVSSCSFTPTGSYDPNFSVKIQFE